jgi:hypothetical protein
VQDIPHPDIDARVAIAQVLWPRLAEIILQQRPLFGFCELVVGGEVAEVEVTVPQPGVFPINVDWPGEPIGSPSRTLLRLRFVKK